MSSATREPVLQSTPAEAIISLVRLTQTKLMH